WHYPQSTFVPQQEAVEFPVRALDDGPLGYLAQRHRWSEIESQCCGAELKVEIDQTGRLTATLRQRDTEIAGQNGLATASSSAEHGDRVRQLAGPRRGRRRGGHKCRHQTLDALADALNGGVAANAVAGSRGTTGFKRVRLFVGGQQKSRDRNGRGA